MFTARPNVLRNAIAIALSSFVLPPVKATQDVKVKLSGFDHSRGGGYTREMVLHFDEDPASATSMSFTDEADAEYTSTFFGSQLAKHNFEVYVTTRQAPDKTATGYTTMLKYGGKEVVALAHELAEGTVRLMVNPALKEHLGTTVKNLLVPEEAGGVEATPKPPLLSPLTDAGDPDSFSRLLAALKTTVTDKHVELQEGAALDEVSSFTVSKLKIEKIPFLRQVVHGVLPAPNPETMLQDSASVFPDPEQSMSLMTTGMLHSIIPEDEAPLPPPADFAAEPREDFQIAAPAKRKSLPVVVHDLLEARPLVSFVTTELTSEEVVSTLPKGIPVLTFGGQAGEVVLNLDQINPAALSWIKGATKGIHSGYEVLKITYPDAPELREACYQEQASILKKVFSSGTEISGEDIGLLSHYQQLISILNFVINQAEDLTLTSDMLAQVHLTGRGIHLRALLAEKFGRVEGLEAVVHSEEFGRRLEKSELGCCASEAALTGDDDFKKLMLHQTIATHQAVQKLTRTSQEQAQEEVNRLSGQIALLWEQIEDTEVVKHLPSGLTQHHFAEIPDDHEAAYTKISKAAQRHPDESPRQLKKEWITAKKLAVHLRGQEDAEQKIGNLARERDSVAALLTPDGKVKTGQEALLKTKLNELGFNGEQDSEVVADMVHTIPGDRMVTAYEDALGLEGINLDDVDEYAVAVAQTGISYAFVTRLKRVAQSNPLLLQHTQEAVEIRQWLAAMANPTDLPDEQPLALLVENPDVLEGEIHQQLRASRELLSEGGHLLPVRDLSGKLKATARLMQALEEDTAHPDLFNTLTGRHADFQNKARDSASGHWLADDYLQELDKALGEIPGAMDHRDMIVAAIRQVNSDELALLKDQYKTFASLHRRNLLTPAALELGQFELSVLEKIKRATMLIPSEVSTTVTRLASVQQQIRQWTTQTVTLMTEVLSWGTMLTEAELMKLPSSADMASPEMIEALQEYLANLELQKTSSSSLFSIIRDTEAVSQLAPSPENPLNFFLLIKQNWSDLSELIDWTGSTVENGELATFKTRLAAAGIDGLTDQDALAIARFMAQAFLQENVEKYCTGLQKLKRKVNTATLTEAQFLQASLDLSAERITKARQLMLAEPETYETLVEFTKVLRTKELDLEVITDLVQGATKDTETPVPEQIRQMQNRVTELDAQLQEMADLKQESAAAPEEKAKLKEEFDELKATIEALEQSFTTAEEYSETVKEKATLPEKVTALSEELKRLRAEHQSLADANTALGKSKESAEAWARDVDNELPRIREELNTKTEEVRQL